MGKLNIYFHKWNQKKKNYLFIYFFNVHNSVNKIIFFRLLHIHSSKITNMANDFFLLSLFFSFLQFEDKIFILLCLNNGNYEIHRFWASNVMKYYLNYYWTFIHFFIFFVFAILPFWKYFYILSWFWFFSSVFENDRNYIIEFDFNLSKNYSERILFTIEGKN